MTRSFIRSLVVAAAVLGSVAYVVVSTRASAQPTPTAGSGSNAGSGSAGAGSGSDDKFYYCKQNIKTVDVNFKPEMDVKDLIAWAMGFSCRNFMYDPRIVATGKKVTIIASKSMSPNEAWE